MNVDLSGGQPHPNPETRPFEIGDRARVTGYAYQGYTGEVAEIVRPYPDEAEPRVRIKWLRLVEADISPLASELEHLPPLPDQPDGIDEDSDDLPDPDRASARVAEFLEWHGDGHISVGSETGAQPPLYARDLEALRKLVWVPVGGQPQPARLCLLTEHLDDSHHTTTCGQYLDGDNCPTHGPVAAEDVGVHPVPPRPDTPTDPEPAFPFPTQDYPPAAQCPACAGVGADECEHRAAAWPIAYAIAHCLDGTPPTRERTAELLEDGDYLLDHFDSRPTTVTCHHLAKPKHTSSEVQHVLLVGNLVVHLSAAHQEQYTEVVAVVPPGLLAGVRTDTPTDPETWRTRAVADLVHTAITTRMEHDDATHNAIYPGNLAQSVLDAVERAGLAIVAPGAAGVRGEPHTTPPLPEPSNVDDLGWATWTGAAGRVIADPFNCHVFIPGKTLTPASTRRHARRLLAAADFAEGGGRR